MSSFERKAVPEEWSSETGRKEAQVFERNLEKLKYSRYSRIKTAYIEYLGHKHT
jgi:hypothetical protein